MSTHLPPHEAEAYVMGLLERADRERIESHLEACASCRKLVAREAQRELVLLELVAQVQAMPEEAMAVPRPSPWQRLGEWWEEAAWWRRLAPAGVLLAAALALVVLLPPRTTELPQYQVTLDGGHKAMRGATATEVVLLSQGAPVEVTVQPFTPVAEAVQVRLFVDEIEVTALLPAERAPSGSVRVRGTFPDLGLSAGDHVLRVVVGPSDARWEGGAPGSALSSANRDAGFQLHEVRFRLGTP